MSEKREELSKRLIKFHKSLLKGLARQSIALLRTSDRLKGYYSLYNKLRNREWDIEKVYDLLAIRIIVKNVEDCYRALGAIHATWRPLPGRIKDYIAFPKPNGYRSLHTTVFTGDGGVVEIQIRTEDMHKESEYGAALHSAYKEQETMTKGTGRKRLFATLMSWKSVNRSAEKPVLHTEDAGSGIPAWVRELGDLDSTVGEQEFWERLREDFFKNRIFIFTPKGDIGDHLVGAKVGGKLVSINTELQNGDIVEILTKNSAHPTSKWLEFARTSIAKKHIRNALQKIDQRKKR